MKEVGPHGGACLFPGKSLEVVADLCRTFVPLTLKNTAIKQVTETKFLGVLIDQHLSWKPHIDFVSEKISKSVVLRKPAFTYLPKL